MFHHVKKKCIKRPSWAEQRSIKRWSVDPTVADIVMSPENDADDVVCNAVLSSRFWQWLSRLCGSGNTNPEFVFDDRTSRRRPKRKAVTFALDWDDQYEAALCARCRHHGELCGRCGAIFTINRPWSLPELKIHHGVAHGTSSPVLKKCLTRSQSTQTTRIVADGQCGSDQCCQ